MTTGWAKAGKKLSQTRVNGKRILLPLYVRLITDSDPEKVEPAIV